MGTSSFPKKRSVGTKNSLPHMFGYYRDNQSIYIPMVKTYGLLFLPLLFSLGRGFGCNPSTPYPPPSFAEKYSLEKKEL